MVVDLNQFTTLMGWNQLIKISYGTGTGTAGDLFTINGNFAVPTGNEQVLRVENYDIGIRQEGDAPDYVTGRSDRTAWRKGPIISEGNLSFPFTIPSSGTQASGLALFLCGAELVKSPGASFTIESSAHPTITGAKVANTVVECSAENAVTSSATIWGISNQDELAEIHSYGDIRRKIWGAGTDTGSTTTVGSDYITFADHLNTTGLPGQGDGADVGGILTLEQIPMFDACSVAGAPEGMFVTGFRLEVDNALQRNYTLGSGVDGSQQSQYSPFGLNATSISASQRRITGTITWQSDYQGYISQILAVGLDSLVIRVGNIMFTLNQVMFNAQPPTLGPSDRVTVESSFTALGTGLNDGNEAFDALIIDVNDQLPPGLSI